MERLGVPPMSEIEHWKPVVGWEDLYEVSDQGRARSLPRIDAAGSRRKARYLKGSSNPDGHILIALCRDRGRKFALLHRLVLEAFVGPCPDGMQGCHWDDDPTNNRLSNLRWDTPRANSLDNVRNGNHVQARKTHCSRGHEYSPENTRMDRRGRVCIQCTKERSHEAYLRLLARKARGVTD